MKPTAGKGYLADLKKAIRAELKADGCTQADLAWYLGITPKHASQVLTGKVDGRFEMIERMAAAVGLEPGITPAPARTIPARESGRSAPRP